MLKHGYSRRANETEEYKIWTFMRSRCNNKNHRRYKDYGGRGIQVCERWDDFENFLEDMGKRHSKNHSIDRIDVNGHYEPSNCTWATKEEQARNQRVRIDSKTRIPGVTKHRKGYIVNIGVNSKQVYIGCYKTIEEAINARKAAEIKYWQKMSS